MAEEGRDAGFTVKIGDVIPRSEAPEKRSASKYAPIWDAADRLKKNEALPVQFDSLDDSHRFVSNAASSIRGRPFKVSRKDTTVYLMKRGESDGPRTKRR